MKGRYREDKIEDDHRLLDATYPVLRWCVDERIAERRCRHLRAQPRLRDDYVQWDFARAA